MCARSKRNTAIKSDYASYETNLKTDKFIGSPFVVQSCKGNHPSSYYDETNVVCSAPLGNTCISCEIRNMPPFNYSFSYKSDWLREQILARVDVGDGTHNNRAPGIPLEETSIPTPHIHLYREDGYFLAYRIDGIDYSSNESVKFDYYQGYQYLCERLNISGFDNVSPLFEFRPKGKLNLMVSDIDPNEGVEFPNNNDTE